MPYRPIQNLLLVVGCLSALACGEEAPETAPIAPGTASGPEAIAAAQNAGNAPLAAAGTAVGAAVGAVGGPIGEMLAQGSNLAVVGGPSVTVVVPMPPTVRFEIGTFAEYQIDVEGQRDPHVFLYRGPDLITRDDDGGEGRNARIIAALTPGAYEVRLHEHTALGDTMQARVMQLPPLVPVANLSVGSSFEVVTSQAGHDRASMSEVTLTIAAPGEYRIDATSAADNFDPKIRLLQGLVEIETDDDGGDGHNARIDRHLDPGTYQLRVWDFSRRGGTATVSLSVQ